LPCSPAGVRALVSAREDQNASAMARMMDEEVEETHE
jgi:hypothetical protein